MSKLDPLSIYKDLDRVSTYDEHIVQIQNFLKILAKINS